MNTIKSHLKIVAIAASMCLSLPAAAIESVRVTLGGSVSPTEPAKCYLRLDGQTEKSFSKKINLEVYNSGDDGISCAADNISEYLPKNSKFLMCAAAEYQSGNPGVRQVQLNPSRRNCEAGGLLAMNGVHGGFYDASPNAAQAIKIFHCSFYCLYEK